VPDESLEPLTAAEWKVMKIVWAHKSCAARDVYRDAAREHGWAPSTTKTLLRRLVEKGCLTTQAVGNSFLYRPSEAAVPSLLGAADALMGQILEGTTGQVLSHMVKKSKLSARELAELRAVLDAHAPAEEAR
jgi:BlaI family transcriptional regulator, penicillinase repressor